MDGAGSFASAACFSASVIAEGGGLAAWLDAGLARLAAARTLSFTAVIADEGDSVWVYLTRPDDASIAGAMPKSAAGSWARI